MITPLQPAEWEMLRALVEAYYFTTKKTTVNGPVG